MVNPARKPKLGTVVAVALGGILGALARVYIPWPALTNDQSPPDLMPTLIINLLGAILLGFVSGYATTRSWPEPIDKGLTVGFFGSFTTMSTLAIALILLGMPLVPGDMRMAVLAHLAGYLVLLAAFLALTTILTIISYRAGLRQGTT